MELEREAVLGEEGGKDWSASPAGRELGGALRAAEGVRLNVRRLGRGWGLVNGERSGQSPEPQGTVKGSGRVLGEWKVRVRPHGRWS